MSPPSAPPILTPLVGRVSLLSQLEESASRLVTLTGPPGVGKTRVALELFARRGERGAWIDLSAVRSEAELCARVADGLGLRPSWLEPVDLVDELGWAIEGRGETWIVLDEAEGCVDALRRVLPRWLALAPDTRALLTSRERLGVADEALFDVPPLETEDAVALLAARAGMDEDARGQLEPLAEALDGVPLALELAAARLTLLPPGAIAGRLPSLL
ncbi:MAG: ATP-binding protein, partial [Sandaracinaceae bacterium]